jgi:hypothetical protein
LTGRFSFFTPLGIASKSIAADVASAVAPTTLYKMQIEVLSEGWLAMVYECAATDAQTD